MGLTLASNQVIKKRLWKPRKILRTAKHLVKIMHLNAERFECHPELTAEIRFLR